MDLYFDCGSGISGDMTLGALVDLGVPIDWLQAQLATLPLTGFKLGQKQVFRNGVAAQKIDVVVEGDVPARDYAVIKTLIEESPFSDRVKQIALTAFGRLAEAEAGIHGCPLDKVHFHEVGGIDAIVDIVGAALCVEFLGADNIVASPLALGSGHVECRHGTLPVPAPATVALLAGVPVYGADVDQELVTPTGAAITTTLASRFGPLPAMTPYQTGYGAGTREHEGLANVLRVIGGTFETQASVGGAAEEAKDEAGTADRVVIVETCIDDMNPEIFGYVMERLFDDGALDVYWVPIFMKKNRPATMMQVLCRAEDREVIIARVLSETTAIGVRHYVAQRTTLERRPVVIEIPSGKVSGKQVTTPSGVKRITPEYESCRKLALEKGMPIQDIYREAIAAVNDPAAVLTDKDNK